MGRKWRQTALRLLPLVLRQPGLFQEKAMATHSSTFAWKIPWTAKTSFQNPYFSLSSLPQLITNPQYQRQRRPGRLLGLSGAPLYVSKASLLYLSHQKLIWQSLGHVQNLELEWGPTSSKNRAFLPTLLVAPAFCFSSPWSNSIMKCVLNVHWVPGTEGSGTTAVVTSLKEVTVQLTYWALQSLTLQNFKTRMFATH